MKGLEFFRNRGDKPQEDFEAIEKELGIDLPEKYVFFSSLYLMGEDNLQCPKFLDPKFNTPSGCGSVLFKLDEFKEEYGFYGFFSGEELLMDWNSYSNDSSEYLDHGLVRIASIGIGGGLCLGTREGDSRDKIYLVNWDSDEDYRLISENIFEFSKMLVLEEDGLNLGPNRDYSQLYKNWGEDFWRIKEEN